MKRSTIFTKIQILTRIWSLDHCSGVCWLCGGTNAAQYIELQIEEGRGFSQGKSSKRADRDVSDDTNKWKRV